MSRIRSAGPTDQSRYVHCLEPLEIRRLLSGAIETALKGSLVETDPLARYIPSPQFAFQRNGWLTGPKAGAPLDIALDYLRSNAAQLGVNGIDIGTPLVTSQYADSDTGMSHIYLRQQVNGLEIANADMNFNIARDGRILSVGGRFLNGVSSLNGADITPDFTAAQALTAAANYLNLTLTNPPSILDGADAVGQIEILRAGDLSLDDIPARVRYVATPDGPELAWGLILRTPDGDHWYDMNIGANDGKLLFTSDWTDFEAPKDELPESGPETADYNANYNVYPRPLVSPDSGPRSVVNNPWDLAASPFGWHDTNGTPGGDIAEAQGNNVSAQEDGDANNSGGFRPSGGAFGGGGTGTLNFNFPLDLAQQPSTYQSAAITNLFYWNNLLHDIHFKYGFDEVSGNFQLTNYSGLGAGNDRVNADTQDGSGTNNANFSTPPDGTSGRMQMFNWNFTSPARDSDIDNGVIIHEYGHGVSNRLSGGPANSNALSATQSGGMGEGWSDWWSLMLTQTSGSNAAQNATYPVGAYVVGQSLSETGIRRFPYSANKDKAPLTWDVFNSDFAVHRTGEIWSSTLWDMNWLLINKHGFNPNVAAGYTTSPGNGNLLALRLVMDGLKLHPANPSVTQARDAILQADTALTGGANQREIWTAFARRGLGVSAFTADSNSLTLTAAFDIPANLGAPHITHHSPSANVILTSSINSITFKFDEAINPASFSAASDITTFSGAGGVNLLPQITSTAFSNGNRDLTVNFNAQSADGTYTIVIGPNILAADNNAAMDQDLNGTPGQAPDNYTATLTIDARPGPDASGYEASRTTFENINLVAGASGVVSAIDNSDDVSVSIPLGANTFRYYGTTYTGSNQIFVSDNGLISFGVSDTSFANTSLTFRPSQPAIAVMHDDWTTDGSASDQVLYRFDTPNNRLIIEWSEVFNRGDFSTQFGTEIATFQAILSLNTGSNAGDVILNYPDLDLGANRYTNGGSATVGMKANGGQGANRLLLSLWNSPNTWLASSSAVRLSTTTVSGTAYADNNGNFVRDGGEPALANVSIYHDANNNSALDAGENSVVTDALGNYTLGSIPFGSTNIREVTPSGYVQTTPTAGAISPTSGQQLTGINFGNFPVIYNGSGIDDVFTLTRTFGASRVDITVNGAPFSSPLSILTTLTFNGLSGNDSLTIDYVNGSPIPSAGSAGVVFDGGTNTLTGDRLVLLGTSAAQTATFNASSVVLSGTINHSTLENISFDGKLGSDIVNVTAGPALAFPASQRFASLALAGSAVALLNGGGNKLLHTNTLSIAPAATLELFDNDMIVDYSGGTVLNAIQALINSARGIGSWTGPGITSAAAKSNPQSNTTLGAIEATDYDVANGPGALFNGIDPDLTAVLVKYTYYGDTDFNGAVDFDDYVRIDGGFNNGLTGWFNGDFDGSGAIDFDDYVLIDQSFNTQGLPL